MAPLNRLHDLDGAHYALPPEVLEGFQTPALVVYLDRVRENLRRVLGLVGGAARWRPHVKTTKIPRIWAELVRAGLRQFKCATTREAAQLLRVLDREGLEGADLLVAYPHRGPNLTRLGRLAAEYPSTRLSVLCEDPALIGELDPRLSIFVDVNPGMNRTGVPLGEGAEIRALARGAGERFRGLHFYDGHLCQTDRETRRAEACEGYARLLELARTLAAQGLPCGELITSGTPIFTSALAFEPFAELDGCVHRVSPGTVVFHDARSEEENPDLELWPAALVLSRVVSWPGPGLVTCDAGSKSIAAEAEAPCAVALSHPGLWAQTPSEEHLPFEVRSGERPARGEHLLLVPRHVCPTVNLAEEALLIEGGRLLEVVEVAARAHELSP